MKNIIKTGLLSIILLNPCLAKEHDNDDWDDKQEDGYKIEEKYGCPSAPEPNVLLLVGGGVLVLFLFSKFVSNKPRF